MLVDGGHGCGSEESCCSEGQSVRNVAGNLATRCVEGRRSARCRSSPCGVRRCTETDRRRFAVFDLLGGVGKH